MLKGLLHRFYEKRVIVYSPIHYCYILLKNHFWQHSNKRMRKQEHLLRQKRYRSLVPGPQTEDIGPVVIYPTRPPPPPSPPPTPPPQLGVFTVKVKYGVNVTYSGHTVKFYDVRSGRNLPEMR